MSSISIIDNRTAGLDINPDLVRDLQEKHSENVPIQNIIMSSIYNPKNGHIHTIKPDNIMTAISSSDTIVDVSTLFGSSQNVPVKMTVFSRPYLSKDCKMVHAAISVDPSGSWPVQPAGQSSEDLQDWIDQINANLSGITTDDQKAIAVLQLGVIAAFTKSASVQESVLKLATSIINPIKFTNQNKMVSGNGYIFALCLWILHSRPSTPVQFTLLQTGVKSGQDGSPGDLELATADRTDLTGFMMLMISNLYSRLEQDPIMKIGKIKYTMATGWNYQKMMEYTQVVMQHRTRFWNSLQWYLGSTGQTGIQADYAEEQLLTDRVLERIPQFKGSIAFSMPLTDDNPTWNLTEG